MSIRIWRLPMSKHTDLGCRDGCRCWSQSVSSLEDFWNPDLGATPCLITDGIIHSLFQWWKCKSWHEKTPNSAHQSIEGAPILGLLVRSQEIGLQNPPTHTLHYSHMELTKLESCKSANTSREIPYTHTEYIQFCLTIQEFLHFVSYGQIQHA